MLEILILIAFSKSLSRTAESKGRSKGWAALGVLGWIGGELIGAVIGGLVGDGMGAIYGIALLGAAIGAVIAFVVVKSLPPIDAPASLPSAHGVVNANYDPRNPYSPPRVE